MPILESYRSSQIWVTIDQLHNYLSSCQQFLVGNCLTHYFLTLLPLILNRTKYNRIAWLSTKINLWCYRPSAPQIISYMQLVQWHMINCYLLQLTLSQLKLCFQKSTKTTTQGNKRFRILIKVYTYRVYYAKKLWYGILCTLCYK